MARKNIGDILATDDEVEALKPRAKAAQAVEVDTPMARIQKEKRVTIVLEENENIPPTGQFFGADGVGFVLRPGEPASVPMSIIHILDCAVQAVPQVDPTTRQVVGYRERRRYGYRIVENARAE